MSEYKSTLIKVIYAIEFIHEDCTSVEELKKMAEKMGPQNVPTMMMGSFEGVEEWFLHKHPKAFWVSQADTKD